MQRVSEEEREVKSSASSHVVVVVWIESKSPERPVEVWVQKLVEVPSASQEVKSPAALVLTYLLSV